MAATGSSEQTQDYGGSDSLQLSIRRTLGTVRPMPPDNNLTSKQ